MIKFYTAIIMMTLLSSCTEELSDTVKKIEPTCIPEQSQCTVTIENFEIDVNFNVEKLIPEQPFEVSINLPPEFTVKNISGYFEGINMYMGKIPLIFQTTSIGYVAQSQFGSCSESNMQWRMWLVFSILSKDGQPIQVTRFIDLTTSH